jgi:hypothetical protein
MGKYLGLIQLLAKFDRVMQYHISIVLEGESADHGSGKNTLNKLTELMTERVHFKIISCPQSADCTPDSSHQKQLSVKIRYVDVTNGKNDNEICERFLGFTSTDDSSGKGPTDVTLKFLEKNNFS